MGKRKRKKKQKPELTRVVKAVRAYHNTTQEIAEAIQRDGFIRPFSEVPNIESRYRPRGWTEADAGYVFFYPECAQHDPERGVYREEIWNEPIVAFVYDANVLLRKYRARVGIDTVAAAHHDIVIQRGTSVPDLKKAARWKGKKALKRLQKGRANPIEFGFIEILVPSRIPLEDCIEIVDAEVEMAAALTAKGFNF